MPLQVMSVHGMSVYGITGIQQTINTDQHTLTYRDPIDQKHRDQHTLTYRDPIDPKHRYQHTLIYRDLIDQ